VSWTSVPGATAYDIGRLIGSSGWQRVRRVAGSDTTYVDVSTSLATHPHTYQVVTVVGDLASPPARAEPVQGGYKGPGDAGGAPAIPDSSATRGDAACAPATMGFTRCVSAVWTWFPPMAESGAYRRLEAQCPAGTTIVSGGYLGNSDRLVVSASFPTERGWQIEFREPAGSASIPADRDAPAHRIRALALCRRG
jgi:hypothetical protein